MQQGIVGERAVGPDPQLLVRLLAGSWHEGQVADVALLDGVGAREPVAPGLAVGLEPGGQRLERPRGRDVGHGELVERPSSSTWNEADRLKMARPCWMATTRRVVNDRPSRIRSTS